MASPSVSVIIPAFNAATHIGTAIASALDQTLRDLEIVVVDDASSDNTVAVLEDWCARDHRVRLLRAEVNGGPARARNLALEAARGTWIAVLDADDAFAPERLAHLLDIAEATGADMVADNLRLVDAASGAVIGDALPARAGPELVTGRTFIQRNLFGQGGFDYGYLKPLIRRAFLDRHAIRYREQLRIGEDYHLYLDCLLAGARFVVAADAMYTYRLVPGSISRRLSEADLRRLAEVNGELIETAQAKSPELLASLRTRRETLERMLGHVRFVERLKAGRPAGAAAILLAQPEVLPLVVRYGRESVLKRLGLLGFHGVSVRRAGT
jgi:succinoglycan biosynthesis protein ExoO